MDPNVIPEGAEVKSASIRRVITEDEQVFFVIEINGYDTLALNLKAAEVLRNALNQLLL